MITNDDIEKNLIEPLAEFFAKPATFRAIAVRLAAVCPPTATAADLKALADKIIEVRKVKTFPSVGELMTLVKAIKPAAAPKRGAPGARVERVGGSDRSFALEGDRVAALDEAERRAISFLRGSPLAERAIAEGWAVGLLDFAITEGRAPDAYEERNVIALVRANDIDVRDFVDVPDPVPPRRNMGRVMEWAGGRIGEALRRFRATMHETAARKLTSEALP